jgi:hydroxymethylglutaryl-CoA reductase
MTGSRIAGFYRLDVATRRRRLAAAVGLPAADVAALESTLPTAVADRLVENAVGTFGLPFGVALNFRVNGRDHVVPMVVEEPSVIAAASNAALLARAAGGFVAEADRGGRSRSSSCGTARRSSSTSRRARRRTGRA